MENYDFKFIEGYITYLNMSEYYYIIDILKQ